jgi:hypothetical protein
LDVINHYFDDPEMLRLYSLIDCDSFVYNPDTYIGSRDASAVARTLYYFDTLGFLVNNDLISLQDVAILRYRINVFFRNEQIGKALDLTYGRLGRYSGRQDQVAHELARDLYEQLQKVPSSLRGIR